MANSAAQLDTTIEIVTPENIAFAYQVAGPFRRFPAYLIDLGIRFGIVGLMWTLLSVFAGLGGGPLALAIGLIGMFLLEWFYGGFFETYMNGQTPGKRAMGIRVLTVDGQPINGLQAVLRNILRTVDLYPMLTLEMFGVPAPLYILPTYMVGLVTMTLSHRFQRVGDLVCGTLVVIEERSWLTGVVKLEDERVAKLAEYIPPDFRVSRSLARSLAMYVERRRFFAPARRGEVAKYLAKPLLAQFGMKGDTSCDLLLCALYYRTFVTDRAADTLPTGLRGESPFRN